MARTVILVNYIQYFGYRARQCVFASPVIRWFCAEFIMHHLQNLSPSLGAAHFLEK